ncbi:hypothetical protein pqer_cds_1060 [Pandoravirus quercus]|uniref:Uncharacterized protein n=1 Tax=Pandoravirus quercus TaxID=2107709 RepID=A0A2U7UAQ9_9VIRU|nr:hypothetical protein pqer_cds_1060 [Pandoravirus quercus]AVK75482.1 hypothetical protein pqer_cds_1060 [Pandoravirus quercus]
MLHWPSSQRAPSIEAAPLPPPPSRTPSVFDRWLADTGRKTARPPPARYTARTRGARIDSDRSEGAKSSLCLVWPAGQGPKAAGTSLFSFAPATGAAAVANGDHCDYDNNRDDHHRSGMNEHGSDKKDEEEQEYEQYDPTLYMIDQCDWRKYIETRLGNGVTHYNVYNCTAGVPPTPADAEYFAALLREVVASHPELGAIESLGGRPETFVVLGAMNLDAAPEAAHDAEAQQPE